MWKDTGSWRGAQIIHHRGLEVGHLLIGKSKLMNLQKILFANTNLKGIQAYLQLNRKKNKDIPE